MDAMCLGQMGMSTNSTKIMKVDEKNNNKHTENDRRSTYSNNKKMKVVRTTIISMSSPTNLQRSSLGETRLLGPATASSSKKVYNCTQYNGGPGLRPRWIGIGKPEGSLTLYCGESRSIGNY